MFSPTSNLYDFHVWSATGIVTLTKRNINTNALRWMDQNIFFLWLFSLLKIVAIVVVYMLEELLATRSFRLYTPAKGIPIAANKLRSILIPYQLSLKSLLYFIIPTTLSYKCTSSVKLYHRDSNAGQPFNNVKKWY